MPRLTEEKLREKILEIGAPLLEHFDGEIVKFAAETMDEEGHCYNYDLGNFIQNICVNLSAHGMKTAFSTANQPPEKRIRIIRLFLKDFINALEYKEVIPPGYFMDLTSGIDLQ